MSNLSDALRRIHPTAGARLLLADAVCIDQGNVHERSAQVRLMRLIYQETVRVLVWW
jgi:Heterokaryon incompatibility protein (HET)